VTTDSDPLYPATLFQFVAEHIHRPKGRGPTSGRTTTPPAEMPLVEEDALVFRLIASAPYISGTRPATGDMACDPETTASTFRKAFIGVWTRIPESDRREMLAFWRRGPIPAGRDDEPWSRRWPLIQVVDDGPYSPPPLYPDRAGHVLTIPAWLIATQPDCLPGTIARLLAQVHRQASGEHWREVMRMVEEPMSRWEAEEGATATDAELEQKAHALEADYLRYFEARVAQIAHRWGIGDSQEAAPLVVAP
jgi:hypothetical protein